MTRAERRFEARRARRTPVRSFDEVRAMRCARCGRQGIETSIRATSAAPCTDCGGWSFSMLCRECLVGEAPATTPINALGGSA
jgi:late competence protein required for DNA uptake (superfamily II DNA/RNA helicase)